MNEAKVIAICNKKGGVGKTTTTVNLGVGLAKQGEKVLLIDANPQADLTSSLGWKNKIYLVGLSYIPCVGCLNCLRCTKRLIT